MDYKEDMVGRVGRAYWMGVVSKLLPAGLAVRCSQRNINLAVPGAVPGCALWVLFVI